MLQWITAGIGNYVPFLDQASPLTAINVVTIWYIILDVLLFLGINKILSKHLNLE